MRLLPGSFLCFLSRLPIHWLWLTASKSVCNQHTYTTKNRWRSIDAQYHNLAVAILRSLLSIKVANLLIMKNIEQITFQLTYLHDKKLWTLSGRSVSQCGCYRIAVSFPYRGCKSADYEWQWATHFPIPFLTSPRIIDAPLTLILRMGLLPCRFLSRPEWLQILWLCIAASKSLPN